MLCQNCGKNEATTHIKKIVHGEATQVHLCSNCAEHLGYSNAFSGFGMNVSRILSNFFPDVSLLSSGGEELRCPHCGFTFPDVIRTGMMGCPECYNIFYDKLKPSLSRIHGRATYTGKMSSSYDDDSYIKDTIRELQDEMKEAVEAQNFERAAEIRDELKELKGTDKE